MRNNVRERKYSLTLAVKSAGTVRRFAAILLWQRRLLTTAMLAAVCLFGVTTMRGQVRVLGGPARPGEAPKAFLVHADEDFEQFLADASKLIEEKNYNRAIEILHALISRNNSGFVSADGNRDLFVGLRLKATQLLGKLPPEGLDRYRTFYDAQARTYYDAALNGDIAKLRLLVDRYLYTSYGIRALDMLGAVCFDQSQFSQAATCWEQLLTLKIDDSRRAMTLAKAAAAHHLAGESADSARCLGDLKAKFPQATGLVGGKTQNLAGFVDQIRKIDPRTVSNVQVAIKDVWPGFGGINDGAAIQQEANVLLEPRWVVGSEEASDLTEKIIPAGLLALSDTLKPPPGRQGGMRITGQVDKGHVQVRAMNYGTAADLNLPPTVQPVVVGDQIIYRTSLGITSVDAVTGKLRWKDENGIPVMREIQAAQNMGYYYDRGQIVVADQGRHTLTVGGDMVFAVGNFRPYMHPNAVANLPRGNDRLKDMYSDTSTLRALSIRGEGSLKWQIGYGVDASDTADEIIRGGKFLSPPAYRNGRLYVIAAYIDSYHLVCLEAENGSMLWKTTISQAPVMGGDMYGSGPMVDQDRAAPPAVADGKVFCVTNGGVVAAFDADSGQPLWAYQYARQAVRPSYNAGVQIMPQATNPVIVTGGKVICLPCDSSGVLCLSGDSGKPVWSQTLDRRGQADLTYIDDRRFMLSAPGVFVFNVADGKELFGSPNEAVIGRPSVNSKYALLSGDAKLVRMNLADYNRESLDLISPDGLLGNLLCVDGALLAANAMGVCAYFSYDQAFAKMSQRLKEATDKSEHLRLIFDRGRLSFSAKHFPAAMEDLLKARKMAQEANDDAAREEIRPWMYRVCVAVANTCGKADEALKHYQASQEYAATNQEKGHNLLRLAKYYVSIKDLSNALATAQNLGESHPKELLFDVRIGAEADDSVRIPDDAPCTLGKTLAQDMIAAIVATPEGRNAYATFDSQARSEFEKAQAAHDAAALAAVADRWPNSDVAPESLFQAAQELFLQSAKAAPQPAAVMLAEARRHLGAVANGQGKLATAANIGIAMIWDRLGRPDLGNMRLALIEDLRSDEVVAFAGRKATVAEFLKDLGPDRTPASGGAPDIAVLSGPIEHKFTVSGSMVSIVTDHNFEPVRMGDSVLMLKDERIVLVDSQGKDADKATAWYAMSVGDETRTGERLMQHIGPSSRMIAGASKDAKVIAVADPETVSGIEVASAKLAWKKNWSEFGLGQVQFMSVGDGLMIANDLNGKVVCVDLSKGELAWASELTGQNRAIYGPVQIHKGMAMARYNNGANLVCWDTATGKIIASRDARSSAYGVFTPSGMVATVIDGDLNVFDPRQNKDIWPTPRNYPNAAALLAVAGDYIVVGTSQAGNEVEVLSITSGGQVTANFNMGNVAGQAAVPAAAAIAGDKLYLTCGKAIRSERSVFSGRWSSLTAPSVQCFDLKAKKQLWQADIDTDSERVYNVMPLTIAGNMVVFTPSWTWDNQGRSSTGRVSVIDSASGKVIETIDVSQARGNGAARARFTGANAPAAVTNNRMLVETCEGVAVFGGQ